MKDIPHTCFLSEEQEGGQEIGQLWRVHVLQLVKREGRHWQRCCAHRDTDISEITKNIWRLDEVAVINNHK